MLFFLLFSNKDTRFIGPDHIFGLTNTSDHFGAGDIIHGREAERTLKGKEKQRAYIASIRAHLARFNYIKFETLSDAFKFYDKVSKISNSKFLFKIYETFLFVCLCRTKTASSTETSWAMLANCQATQWPTISWTRYSAIATRTRTES
mgnify:CR=1 FL=1